MRRLSLAILAAVGVFVMVVAITLIVKSRSIRPEATEPPPSKADFRIKEVRLDEAGGPVRWRLVADQAEIFESEGRTKLRRPVVDVEQAHRSWRVRADEGDVHQRSKDFEVRSNVVLVSSDGLRLETSVLRWQAAAKRLWTDAPVRITRDGAVVEGNGLDVNVAQEHAEVKGRVRAQFTKAPAVTP